MEKYYSEADLRAVHATRGEETVAKYTWEQAAAQLIRRLRDVRAGEDEN
jgi:outer membrane lipopolysaccharide assembly protein LptE/RlpB